MKHSHLWKFWFGAWLLLFAALTQAALSQIHTLSGSVAITYPGQVARAAQKGDRLEVGTVVATGEKSFAMLRFQDGQVVALKSNSEFRVDQYRFNPKVDQDNQAGFTVSKGGLRAITGLIGKKNPDGFKLDTPTATIGIRGTTFDIFIDGGTFIRVTDGKIAIVNPAGLLELAAGQLAAITSRQTPPAPTTEGELPPGARAGFQEIEGIVVNNLPPTSAGGAGDLGGALGGVSETVTAPPPPPPSPPPTTTPPPPPPTVPTAAPLTQDVFFLALGYENSGSMDSLTDMVRNGDILNRLAAVNDGVRYDYYRWGVGRYFADPAYEEGPAYQLQQALTADLASGQAAINDWVIDDYRDEDFAANFYALQQAVTNGAATPRGVAGTGQNTGWRSGVNAGKSILIFGDVPSYQGSINEQELGQLLKANGVSVSFIDASNMDGRDGGEQDPNAWRSADADQAAGAAQELADLTGGVYIRVPYGFDGTLNAPTLLANELMLAIANPLKSKTLPFSGGYMVSLDEELTWRTRTALSVLAAPDEDNANRINFVLTHPYWSLAYPDTPVEFTLDTTEPTAGFFNVEGRSYKQAKGQMWYGESSITPIGYPNGWVFDYSMHDNSFVQWAPGKDFYRFVLNGDDGGVVVEGYFGTKLASLPGSGVTVFDLFSRARDPEEDASYGTGATPSGELSVNWANKKVFAIDKAPLNDYYTAVADIPTLGFFIGRVNADNKIEGRYYGFELCDQCNPSDSRPGLDDARRGNTNMQLYGTGSTPAGFGGTFGAYWDDGNGYAYTDMMLTGLVSNRNPSYAFTPGAADGSNVLKGFAAAYVRQESDGADVIPALSGGAGGSPDDVVITLNPAAGTLTAKVVTRELEETSGSWTGAEHSLDTTAGGNMSVLDSAYVSPKAFGVIGTSNGEDGGLVTATRQSDKLLWPSGDGAESRPANDEFQYTSWGIWGRTELNDGSTKRSIEPESLWVAGKLTDITELNALATGGDYGYGRSGTYRGEVRGYRVETTPTPTVASVTGTTNLTVNFASRTVTGTFDNLMAAQTNWVQQAAVSATWGAGTNAIKGTLSSTESTPDISGGTINGAFFGPNARELGGNWAIQKSDNSAGAGIHRSIQQELSSNPPPLTGQ